MDNGEGLLSGKGAHLTRHIVAPDDAALTAHQLIVLVFDVTTTFYPAQYCARGVLEGIYRVDAGMEPLCTHLNGAVVGKPLPICGDGRPVPQGVTDKVPREDRFRHRVIPSYPIPLVDEFEAEA